MFGITWRKPVKKLSPLNKEIQDLISKYNKKDRLINKLSNEFWRDGGVCCPSCGVPGFSRLINRQEAREKRLEQLRAKIYLDSQSSVDPLKWAYVNHQRRVERARKNKTKHSK